ncbi:MAG: prephenate dehydrogenase [Pseudomonadota bacterium]
MRVERLVVVGTGLIGGSVIAALRHVGAVGEVVGLGRAGGTVTRARELGLVDRAETDPARALAGADVVLVAVPVGAMAAVFAELAPHLEEATVLMDAGSTKASVVAAAEAAFGELPPGFVPAHPIAGNEASGPEAADAGLFRGRRVIITPTAASSPGAIAAADHFWSALGAEVVSMTPAHHDAVLAATSHLPHMLAYALVDSLARRDDVEEIFDFAAGGFRDFTRIASSDPTMWHDICLHNRDALLPALAGFREELRRLEQAVEAGDGDFLHSLFSRAKQARDRFLG